jgi:hypothetical protein
MKKATKKLKTYEQFQSEEIVVSIDVKRLNDLINMTTPLLEEITRIIEQEEDRSISVEMLGRIDGAINTLDELSQLYK